MTTITLPLSPGLHYSDCVEAEIVNVAPHLAHIATFAVDNRGGHMWVVSHVETGYYAAKAGDKNEALSIARCKLATLTPAQFMARCVAPVADTVRALSAAKALREEGLR